MDESTFSLWEMTEGSIPGMSSCVQAKMSMLSFRKSIRAFLILPSICVPILVVLSGFSSSSTITSSFWLNEFLPLVDRHCLVSRLQFERSKVAFSCCYLIPFEFPYAMFRRESDEDVIC